MEKYKFFWGGILSNWFESNFEIDSIKYNTSEQYMMYQKALFFNDIDIANKILKEKNPKYQKKLGREVKNFNIDKWNNVKYDIVKKGILEKFKQNPELKKYLLKYKGYKFVEASPYDRIWGIGFLELDAIKNIDKWGENLLGQILTELSNELF